jgi:hypothetical protein
VPAVRVFRSAVNRERREYVDLGQDDVRSGFVVTLMACAGPHAAATAGYWYGDELALVTDRGTEYETVHEEYTGVGTTAWGTAAAIGGFGADQVVLNVDTAELLRPASMLGGDATGLAVAALVLHRGRERPPWHGHRLHLVRADDPLVPTGAVDLSQTAFAMLARVYPETVRGWAAAAVHDPPHLRDLGLAAVSTGSPELTAALTAHLGRAWPKAFTAAWDD